MAEAQEGPIFVGGACRSGTTLMRVMLDAHPRICCGPELKLMPAISDFYQLISTSFAGVMESYHNKPDDVLYRLRLLLEGLVENFRRAQGKPRWAEKTPHNVLCMALLGRMFPTARFLHLIRDGRDVACSLVGMNWLNPQTGAKPDFIKDIANASSYWRQVIQIGRTQAADPVLNGRVMEVRYESLVQETEATMRKILQFVGEPWDAAVLNAHEKTRAHEPHESSTSQVAKPIYDSSIGRWRKNMSESDKAAFRLQADELLKSLGYASDNW